MRRYQVLIAVTPALLAFTTSRPAFAQHEHPQVIGTVSFPTSCAPAVQPGINRAVAMLHSFWFEQANAAFSEVAAADSTCAIAAWGIAMTQWGNPFVRQPIPAERQRVGLAAAERAFALSSRATDRERAYVNAALALWRDGDRLDHLARMRAHEDAMKIVRDNNVNDPEAALFYARALIANSPQSDLTFARQLQAAALLEPLLATYPDHPGLTHYLIHAFDSPRLAQQGLEAAKRYASIAPAAPHALHMPSHIFTRLGYWDESIATNRRSAAAEPDSNAAVHPLDYMVYALLQQGRDTDARAIVQRLRTNTDDYYRGILGYNAAAIPARYALERSGWEDASKLALPSGAPAYVEAVTRFARAVGAARSGKVAQARTETAALAALRDTLKAHKDSYWATVVDAQRLAASAWIARAEKRTDDAVRLAREAADLEETVEKHPVTPGPLLPARELEGDLLFAIGRPGDALKAYEQVLAREPRRARSLYGAARSAQQTGKRTAAKARYEELNALMVRADQNRAEALAARLYLGRS